MLARIRVRRWGVMALSTLAMLLAAGGVRAQDCYQCQRTHCPPCYKHCQEGAPRIKFQCGCPQPICNPCNAPNWGYFQTCWMRYPWQTDTSHCAVPLPAVSAPAPANLLPALPPALPQETAPVQRLPNTDESIPPRPLNRPGLE